MKKMIAMVFFAGVVLAEAMTVVKVGFPPTEQQLSILKFVGMNLWSLRIISFLVILGGIWCWSKVIKIKWSGLIMLLSPVLMVVWMSYPLVGLIFTIIGGIYILKNIWGIGKVTVLAMVVLLAFNLKVLNYHPEIFNHFRLSEAQNEITMRISSEDSLREKIIFPIWWRRISDNKYFYIYKKVINDVIPFFDFESVFFEEVHPLNQKSNIIFFWPEIVLATLGIYFFYYKKNTETKKLILATVFLAWVGFVFSEGNLGFRLIWVIVPVTILIATSIKKMPILWTLLASILVFYGWGVNLNDIVVRKEYWLDNRPIIYDNWFKEISKLDRSNFQKIQITSLVGNPKEYCEYYLGKECNEPKFVFKNFNLKEEVINDKTLYAGFSGEFVGPKFKNDIDSNWMQESMDKGLTFIATSHTFDTVAYQYGNDIGLAAKY